MIDKLREGIEVSKNLLDTLPKNNIKNKKKYKEVLSETLVAYQDILTRIESAIDKKYNKYININDERSLDDELKTINYIKDKLFLLNNYNSSYEKLEFDKILYRLNHFYKSDLNEANKNILDCIKIFEQVGIKLKAEDFNYSEYTYEYMKVLLSNKEDIDLIKDTFEKIYWQCSDLLIHIELNIKYLYYSNQNAFEKYVAKEKNDFLKLFTTDPLKCYKSLVITYNDNKSRSLSRGLDKFMSREWNINDYQEMKIDKIYSFFTNEVPSEEINEEISKLANSALEYKNYLSFKYIIDDLKKKYEQKSNQKNELKNINKEINKREKLIHKYNKKKNNKEKINTKIMTLIHELESLYEKLDEVIFLDRIFKNLNEDSSIYDALCLACSNYSYIIKCMKQYEREESFEVEQQKLIDYILNPYNNIIMNIALSEEKDIALIISDKYKLSNFNISKDNLSSDEGIDEIIRNASLVDVYRKIVTKLSYDNLKFIEQVRETLKK